jgi:hypothetical protein
MAFEITQLVGAEFPLFAFSHCRDVVAAVSRAGGFGVLGGARFSAESLEEELKWIDDHVDGKPYGIDILIPEHQAVKPGTSVAEVAAMLPPGHRAFVEDLLRRSSIEPKASRLRRCSNEAADTACRWPLWWERRNMRSGRSTPAWI